MYDLNELYQEVILDHSQHPRCFGDLADTTHTAEGVNPLCGDHLEVYLKIENGNIADIKFKGAGCAISTASASLMSEAVKGKSCNEAEILFQGFHQMLTQEGYELGNMGKLEILAGVKNFPMRVKCATLAWHTLHAAMMENASHQPSTVTTEE